MGSIEETGMAVVHKGETITPAKKESGSEGGLLGTLSNLAGAAMNPLGAIGGLLGGGGGGGSDPALTKAIEDLNAVLSSGIMATVSADQAADAVNTANSYKTS